MDGFEDNRFIDRSRRFGGDVFHNDRQGWAAAAAGSSSREHAKNALTISFSRNSRPLGGSHGFQKTGESILAFVEMGAAFLMNCFTLRRYIGQCGAIFGF